MNRGLRRQNTILRQSHDDINVRPPNGGRAIGL